MCDNEKSPVYDRVTAADDVNLMMLEAANHNYISIKHRQRDNLIEYLNEMPQKLMQLPSFGGVSCGAKAPTHVAAKFIRTSCFNHFDVVGDGKSFAWGLKG